MSSEISEHPGWVVISQPQAVYGIQTNVSRRSLGNGTETATSDLSGGVIAGIVVGCLVIVSFVACLVYRFLNNEKNAAAHDESNQALIPKENTDQGPKPLAGPTSRLFHIKIDHPQSAQKHI